MVIISVFSIVPRVVSTLNTVEMVALSANDAIERAQTTMDELDKMAGALTATGDGMNTLINENGDKLTESLEKMSGIDFDGLNKGIQDLQDAIGPFANIMNRFR